MRASEVSKRYARALYELAKSNNKGDQVFAELRTLQAAFTSDRSIAELMESPLVTPEQRKLALTASTAGKVSEELFNTLMLLAEKNRLYIFSDLVLSYQEISDEDQGLTRGWVKSASPLAPGAKKRIEDTIAKATGKKVILSFSEDPKLLGGTMAQVGGWTFDDSLESHLTRMSEDLNRRAN